MPAAKPNAPPYVDPKGEFPLDAATYLFHLFVVIGRHRDAALDKALGPIGLTVSRHRALSVIARMAPCTMSQLADFSAVDRTTMTRTVDQLVAAGLVDRLASAKDRRQVLLTPTQAGRRAYRASLKVIQAHNLASLAGVPDALRRVAVRAHERILLNIVDDPELAMRLLFREPQGVDPASSRSLATARLKSGPKMRK
jgi:DNA-binding MarR family transcriptional regulator